MQKVILYLTALESGGAADYTFSNHHDMLLAGHRSYVAIAGKKILTPEGNYITINEKYGMSLWDRIKRYETKYLVNARVPYIEGKYVVLNTEERIQYHNPRDLFESLPELPDYIFVHWVSGFANAKYIRDLQKLTGAKVFFVMLDEAILSGGCHYCWKCDGISNGCKNCSMTTSRSLKFHIRWNYLYKMFYLPKERNVIVCSKYDEEKLLRSQLWKNANVFKIYVKIDEQLFRPTPDKFSLRKKYNLPQDKKIIFFGCTYLSEERKGMTFLVKALNKINADNVICLIAGRGDFPQTKIESVNVGHLAIKELADCFRLADCYVCSSLEDSGPQMVNMALMSGCPTVSFTTGVALDFVKTGETGYLAKWGDIDDLARGMDYIIELSKEKIERMSKNCREIALQNFSSNTRPPFYDTFLNQ